MKLLFYLAMSFIIISCSSNKTIFWCGDHPCIDKNEKEAYFKKTMIVEVKDLSKKNLKENSEIEKILQQVQTEKKGEIKEEKVLAKQAKLDKKRRINEEKVLSKQMEQNEKKIIKKDKKKSKKSTNVNGDLENIAIASTNFQKKVKEISKRNFFRPYPDINDIPN